jgi:uncharacterized protein YceH (UPF0502 family)
LDQQTAAQKEKYMTVEERIAALEEAVARLQAIIDTHLISVDVEDSDGESSTD